MSRYAMAVDVDLCLGCEACLVACQTENELPEGRYRLRMQHVVEGVFPDLTGEFRVESCYHCEDAPCLNVCPTGATYQTESGLVLVDPAKCTGCKACLTACPYGMRYVHPNGYVDKCTLCDHRLEIGEPPACVTTCPTGARAFGDLENPDDPIHAYMGAATSTGTADEKAGAHPQFFYLNSRFSAEPEGEHTVISREEG